jgi:hypothetical protein
MYRDFEVKPLGRPRCAPEDEKSQFNVRLTKPQQLLINKAIPDEKNMPWKIVTIIDNYLKTKNILAAYDTEENNEVVLWSHPNAYRIATINKYEGENRLLAFKENCPYSDLISNLIGKQKITKELYLEQIIPALEEQGFIVHKHDTGYLFDVFIMKIENGEACIICKNKLENNFKEIYEKEKKAIISKYEKDLKEKQIIIDKFKKFAGGILRFITKIKTIKSG